MKKLIVFTLVVLLLLTGCAKLRAGKTNDKAQTSGNFTDDMKIPYTEDMSPEDGADSVEREGDHEGSPYFSSLDFYNLESNDTLTILHNFKTQQQTTEWSCGVTSALMVVNWYGKLGGFSERTLAEFRSDGGAEPGATSLQQIEQHAGPLPHPAWRCGLGLGSGGRDCRGRIPHRVPGARLSPA